MNGTYCGIPEETGLRIKSGVCQLNGIPSVKQNQCKVDVFIKQSGPTFSGLPDMSPIKISNTVDKSEYILEIVHSLALKGMQKGEPRCFSVYLC